MFLHSVQGNNFITIAEVGGLNNMGSMLKLQLHI